MIDYETILIILLYLDSDEVKMIEQCNFKSRIRHRDSPGCRLTPPEVVCPGEENCILYQIYQNIEKRRVIYE